MSPQQEACQPPVDQRLIRREPLVTLPLFSFLVINTPLPFSFLFLPSDSSLYFTFFSTLSSFSSSILILLSHSIIYRWSMNFHEDKYIFLWNLELNLYLHLRICHLYKIFTLNWICHLLSFIIIKLMILQHMMLFRSSYNSFSRCKYHSNGKFFWLISK